MEIESLHETIKCPEFVRRLNVVIYDGGFTVSWTCNEDPFISVKDSLSGFLGMLRDKGVDITDWDSDNGRYDFFCTDRVNHLKKQLVSLPFPCVFCYSKNNGLTQLKGD